MAYGRLTSSSSDRSPQEVLLPTGGGREAVPSAWRSRRIPKRLRGIAGATGTIGEGRCWKWPGGAGNEGSDQAAGPAGAEAAPASGGSARASVPARSAPSPACSTGPGGTGALVLG